MHNIKEIRKDFDAFSKALKKRSIDIDLNKLCLLYTSDAADE